MEDYRELMDKTRIEIDSKLADFFENKMKLCSDEFSKKIIELIRDFTMNGGKRVRPILMIMGHDLFKKRDKRIVDASISIELTQTYLLIHDDIMDQSEVRRGKPSFHVAVREKLLQGIKDSKRVSENLAIVAGDLSDSYSHQALIEAGFGSEETLNANVELTGIIETTGHGQILDIYSSIAEDFKQSDLMRLHLWKTAKYTIEGPLMMGALLAGAKKDLSYLSYYGYLLGVAFQLYDDILGLFGDEKVTGKSIKNDVNEGKKTLLMIKAMEQSTPEDAKFIRSCLSSGNVDDKDFERLQSIVKEVGSYEYSLATMKKLIEKSKEYLNRIEGDDKVKEFLSWFADYIISRTH